VRDLIGSHLKKRRGHGEKRAKRCIFAKTAFFAFGGFKHK
jgi:hypothetical protein